MRWIHWWPPLLEAGMKVRRMDPDLRAIDVEMPLTRLNKNYMGVHFGGSLYTITDPFYMVMLARNLGPDYIVWDKAATIRYRKPGRGTVRAEFRLTQATLDEVRKILETEPRYEPRFTVLVTDREGDTVAEVERTLYIARKSVHEERLKARQQARQQA